MSDLKISKGLSILAFLLLGIVVSGCLQTRNEKVVLKEDVLKKENLEKQQIQLAAKTMREKLADKMAYKEKIALSEKEYREEIHRENTHRAVANIHKSIPKDPFESFENERSRVLNRKFTDTRNKGSKD